MARSTDAISVAVGQAGVIEVPTNRTLYGRWYTPDGEAWCAKFVCWTMDQIGMVDTVAFSTPKGYSYTPTGALGFQKQGRWGTTPLPGAHVFFRFPGGPARIHHVGLVVGFGPGYVDTIEGNTSRGTAGSQRDGGGVWRRRRSTGIVGYGYPPYDTNAPVTPPGCPIAKGDDWRTHPVLKEGSRGPLVRHLQELLICANHDLTQEGGADGIFGSGTTRELESYQDARGLASDGECGPLTWERLHT